MFRNRILFHFALVLMVVSAASGNQEARIAGRVINSSGGSVSKAVVLVYAWYPESKDDFALREVGRFVTDTFGEFHGSLPAGSYELLCATRGLLPAAVRVQATLASETRVSIRLQRDPSLPIEACCETGAPPGK